MTEPMSLISKDKFELKVNKIKSKLIAAFMVNARGKGLTQKEIAEITGVSQPRVSDIMNGQISKFSVDTLIVMCMKMDCDVMLLCSYEKILQA